MYNTYDVGDLVRLEAEITISGSFVDPSYLVLSLRRPDTIVLKYVYGIDVVLVKDSTGRYHLDYYVPSHGQYYYEYQASGVAWGVEEKSFLVRIPNVV